MNKFKATFDSITAEENLMAKTYENVLNKRKRQSKSKLYKGFALAAACFAVLLFITLTNGYSKETLYISLDINPSISLSVNSLDKVISANYYNDEGRQLLESVSVKNKDYNEAVKLIMDSPKMQPYLAKSSQMWVAVQSADNNKQTAVTQSLQAIVDTTLKAHHADAKVEYYCVDEETKTNAGSSGVSAYKYTAIQTLKELNPNVSVEEYKHHSIPEITKEIASHHANNNDDDFRGSTDSHGTTDTQEQEHHNK